MLKSMRSNIKKLHWVLWIIILSFVLWGVGSIGQLGQVPSDVIKSVEGINVTFRDFELAYRRMASFYAEMYGDSWTPEMAERLNLRQTVLNGVVEEAERAALAENARFRVSSEELRQAIMEMPELQDEHGNFLGREAYLQILRMNNLTVSDFENNLKKGLLTQKLRNYFQHTIVVSEAEAYQNFLFENTKKEFDYITINPKELEEIVEYTEEELEEFFEENKENYILDEQRSINYVVFDPKVYEEGIVNERDLLREYYMSHREEFRQEEQVKASHILLPVDPDDPDDMINTYSRALELKQEIEEGADFGLFARMYSEDPGTKEKGGDLGFFGRGQMVGPFEEVAFSLDIGEISDPVETQFGIHIIKVKDRKPPAILPFEEVEHRIDSRLKGMRADRMAQRASEGFSGSVSTVREFEQKAQEMGLELKTAGPFYNKATVPNIGHAPDIVHKSFSMSERDISVPVKVRNNYYVFTVKDIIEPYIPDLEHEDTKKSVIADLKKEKAKALAETKAEMVRSYLTQGHGFEEIKEMMPEVKLQKRTTGKINVSSNVFGLKDRDQVLQLFTITEDMIYGPVSHDDGQWVLYYLTGTVMPDPEEYDSTREKLARSLKEDRGRQVFRSWFERAKEKLSTRTNNELLRYILES